MPTNYGVGRVQFTNLYLVKILRHRWAVSLTPESHNSVLHLYFSERLKEMCVQVCVRHFGATLSLELRDVQLRRQARNTGVRTQSRSIVSIHSRPTLI